jgi:hypothetical protein
MARGQFTFAGMFTQRLVLGLFADRVELQFEHAGHVRLDVNSFISNDCVLLFNLVSELTLPVHHLWFYHQLSTILLITYWGKVALLPLRRLVVFIEIINLLDQIPSDRLVCLIVFH